VSFIRFHQQDAIHFVTNRIEHQMFLLLPTKKVNELILYWLARARVEYGDGIDIFGFIFLSNHFHILLRDTSGNLASFMNYFQGNLGAAVNAHWGRKGTFWQDSYHDLIVHGENEFWNRYAYTLANPVKSGLVGTPSQWRGISALPYLLENKPIHVKGLLKSRYNESRRFKKNVQRENFERTWTFHLAPPPGFEKKPHNRLVEFTRQLLQSACAKYRRDRAWKAPLGMQRVLRQHPLSHPSKVEKKPRTRFFCLDRAKLESLEESYRAFADHYRECVLALRRCGRRVGQAMRLEWPVWSYPPCHLWPVGF